MPNERMVNLLVLSVLYALLALSVCAQDPPPNTKWKLAKIEFEGLQTQPRDKIIAASELQIGQTVDMEAIKAAAGRLAQSGAFKKVAYRYRYSSTQIELTFEVEEAKSAKYACIFDNFIWFTDLEIKDAVVRESPSFDGTAPDGDLAINDIKRALTRLLQERKVAGEITHELNENQIAHRTEHIFKVKGANLKVCEVQFAGANENLKKPLLDAAQELFKNEYSRLDTSLFAYAALIPVYRQRGYLKAGFQQPQAKLSAAGACANAVIVTLPVEEGLQYRWDQATWSGNQAFTSQELDEALRLKSGDVADLMKIEGGWVDAGRVYGKKGYLKARVKPEAVFDDTRQLVSYRATVIEGPQYRMGQLMVTGLAEDDANRVKGAWQLKAGDVYDNSYAGVFLSKLGREGLVRQAKGFKVKQESKPDDQKLAVDLVLKFEQ